jgi:hypothetical protein
MCSDEKDASIFFDKLVFLLVVIFGLLAHLHAEFWKVLSMADF